MSPVQRWGVMWRSDNRLDGSSRSLIGMAGAIHIFRTRAEARALIRDKFGYIAARPDLKAEPHGWKMPIPVRVSITEVLP